MSDSFIDLDQKTFQSFVADGLALVDFWAPWCGPCRMQAPILETLSTKMPNVKFGKVNVDDNPDLAAQYNVNTIPFLAIFKGGALVNQFVGMRQEDVIVAALQKELGA